MTEEKGIGNGMFNDSSLVHEIINTPFMPDPVFKILKP